MKRQHQTETKNKKKRSFWRTLLFNLVFGITFNMVLVFIFQKSLHEQHDVESILRAVYSIYILGMFILGVYTYRKLCSVRGALFSLLVICLISMLVSILAHEVLILTSMKSFSSNATNNYLRGAIIFHLVYNFIPVLVQIIATVFAWFDQKMKGKEQSDVTDAINYATEQEETTIKKGFKKKIRSSRIILLYNLIFLFACTVYLVWVYTAYSDDLGAMFLALFCYFIQINGGFVLGIYSYRRIRSFGRVFLIGVICYLASIFVGAIGCGIKLLEPVYYAAKANRIIDFRHIDNYLREVGAVGFGVWWFSLVPYTVSAGCFWFIEKVKNKKQPEKEETV